jgi:hypothetical protein
MVIGSPIQRTNNHWIELMEGYDKQGKTIENSIIQIFINCQIDLRGRKG